MCETFPRKRSDALREGLTWYHTGKACVHGHLSKRLAANGYCYECSKIGAARWRMSNQQHLQAYERRQWRENKEKRQSYFSQWAKANPSKMSAKEGMRRALRGRATPSWIDKGALQKVYADCRARTEVTGVLHHVDHIVPLKNSIVCGLHVPWNLQVLTASENSRKKNKFEGGITYAAS